MHDTLTEDPAIPRIRPLPPALANQIAAGEVVERPASVAKELLENSLDAGARNVEVEVEEAGIRLLRVRDDGTGIHRDDLVLALARHATSKIHTIEDLQRVASLGFRGEALPSIASVSRFVLSSRTAGETDGWQVRVDGGRAFEGPMPVAHGRGTTVEVRDLFYNVPARRKFLKTPRTELIHLEDVARRVALSRFEVGLRLRHDRREVLSLRPALDEAGRARRVAAVCGAAFLESALWVEYAWEGLRLSGWLGLPEAARSQADIQYLFLNGRPVRDRLLVHAVRQAYQDRVYPGRQPAYVLELALDPELVDVNVHPTKQEVRFREPRVVHDFVARYLGRTLAGPELVPGPAGHGGDGPVRGPAAPPGEARPPVVAEVAAPYRPSAAGGAWRAPAPGDPPGAGPMGRTLGVAHGRFLLAETSAGVTVVDLQATAELLTRRGLEEALAAGTPASRPLLLPLAVTVDRREAQAAEDFRETFVAFGLELTRSGPESVVVRRVPAAVHDVDPELLCRAVLAAVARGGEPGPSLAHTLGELARTAGAVIAARASGAQIDALLRALDAIPPSERPTGLARELTPDDLARLLAGGPGARRL